MAKRSTKSTPAKKHSAATKKVTVRKKPVASHKVDYYPNRMTVAIAVLAGTLIVLLALITVLGVHR